MEGTTPEMVSFMYILKQNRSKLSAQQYRTLKGQAVSGNVDAAHKGLHKILRRRHANAN
jgi:hypothetical protein